jgi:hypothetical protein
VIHLWFPKRSLGGDNLSVHCQLPGCHKDLTNVGADVGISGRAYCNSGESHVYPAAFGGLEPPGVITFSYVNPEGFRNAIRRKELTHY